jgi:SpoVK/Ycf46/Vps4 family AAA+-type ATPase
MSFMNVHVAQLFPFTFPFHRGKTMLANAVATKLKRKVLLVNFPDLGGNQSGAILKFLFREARINRSVLFFDECESMFMDRKKGPSSVNMLLTELERFDGLCILATNRAHDLDEAMHRRISLAIEFRKPDHIMREKIWRTLQPPKVPLEDDIQFGMIAKKYELTGGLIKNAWLQSVGLMVQRGGDKISQDDLMQAAGEQVIGQLTLEDFDRRVVPTCGLESMVLAPAIKESLSSIVQYTKAQSVLFGQWGFEKIHRSTTGISALFTGPPGTGKSMAAE